MEALQQAYATDEEEEEEDEDEDEDGGGRKYEDEDLSTQPGLILPPPSSSSSSPLPSPLPSPVAEQSPSRPSYPASPAQAREDQVQNASIQQQEDSECHSKRIFKREAEEREASERHLGTRTSPPKQRSALPPPPDDLLNSSNSSSVAWTKDIHKGRIRSFPHVDGNFALHVYIPVPLSSIAKRQLEPLVDKAFSMVKELQPIETDVPVFPAHLKSKDILHVSKLAKEYHISLSRTTPIRVHQIDSIVPMLRHKFLSQKRYWLEFDQWEVFVNDDQTRSFLSLEVLGKGMSEICRQIHCVNEVFRLHKLPTFYENPRPHISIAWALGNVAPALRIVAEELNRCRHAGANKTSMWLHLFSRIECKIGCQTYCVWQATMQPKESV